MNQEKTGKEPRCSPEECAVPASHVAPVVLLLVYFTSHIRKHQLTFLQLLIIMKCWYQGMTISGPVHYDYGYRF
jgi:hypothetical protein